MLDGESGESVGVSSLEELCSKRDGNGVSARCWPCVQGG
jgi:hypothetical protein